MSTFETAPFREYRAVISPELVPVRKPASTMPSAKDVAAKNLELQARFILLKRDRFLQALKLRPEQMVAWPASQRLTERSNKAVEGETGASS
jgi:hypothetical protein